MLHRNSSAGTAAQKSSKSSLVQRPAIILAILLLCSVCHGQKIAKNKYNKVDTIFQYQNAAIIIYKQKSIPARDTIYFKQTPNWHVNKVDVLNLYNDEIFKRRRPK